VYLTGQDLKMGLCMYFESISKMEHLPIGYYDEFGDIQEERYFNVNADEFGGVYSWLEKTLKQKGQEEEYSEVKPSHVNQLLTLIECILYYNGDPNIKLPVDIPEYNKPITRNKGYINALVQFEEFLNELLNDFDFNNKRLIYRSMVVKRSCIHLKILEAKERSGILSAREFVESAMTLFQEKYK